MSASKSDVTEVALGAILDDEARLKISRYVMHRQNPDGGYTFAQWTESSAQDTYFALQILQMLDAIPEHCEETTQFLQVLQRTDGTYDSMNQI